MNQTPTTASEGDRQSRYKATLNLPRTAFAMKANLVQNEPASLKRWEECGLYRRLEESRAGASRFVFHDGPPYANGNIHLGHLLNKVLKDFVVRVRLMEGKSCPFVPGWDCHGLPIEHKVMSELQEAGKLSKLQGLAEDQRRMAVRRECRKYAEKFVRLQSGQMKRLLTLASYDDPYLTMSPRYEAAALEVFADLVESGLVYRRLKAVHWSPANETALADAELEYYEREDLSVYVDFEAEDQEAVYDAFGLPGGAGDAEDDDEGDGEGGRPTQRPCFMIWTTTPWTLPANLAIAVNPSYEYALVRVDGNITVIAKELVERVTGSAKAEDVRVLATAPGERLLGLRYRHPLHAEGGPDLSRLPEAALRGADPGGIRRIVAAEYVTLEDGTGLVHTAPGHGAEDYQTGLRERLPIYCPVLENGSYDGSVPEALRGADIWEANGRIVEMLRNSGHLFHDHRFTHSYPHDWRGKSPVIFRATEQWFIGVDTARRSGAAATPGGTLRELALEAAASGVRFVPEWGRNRMRGMLESRPDWCISRQRAWGLPIPAFYGPDGSVLLTAASVRAVAAVIREKGSDAWFERTPAELLAGYDAESDPDAPRGLDTGSLVKGSDIFDVWFESGCSWNAVMRERSGGADFPVDLYLEGSDQHRGWFQVSLLTALGATGRAPYRALLTHGFIVDKDGKKMSKSLGNALDVEELLKEFGADVCRWWVATLAYDGDIKADIEFFRTAGESYRKVRNTLRFMLSNLEGYSPGEGDGGAFGPLTPEAWALGAFDEMSAGVRAAYDGYDFRRASTLLFNFCNETMSAVYLAAIKDRLYCDEPGSERRRRTQRALHRMTEGLCLLLAPILPHTADEAWRALQRVDGSDRSATVHERVFPAPSGAAPDAGWGAAMHAREVGLAALEATRQKGLLDNPLDAEVVLPDPERVLSRFDSADLADLLGVSRVKTDPLLGVGSARVNDLRSEPRCERSWKRDGTVRVRSDGGTLCERCARAVGVA